MGTEGGRGFDQGGHRHRNWQSTRWKVWTMLAVEIQTHMPWGMDDSGNHKALYRMSIIPLGRFGFLPGIDLWQKLW